MADDSNLIDTADPDEVSTDQAAASKRFQDLEDTVKRLQKENAELKANADTATQQLPSGVCHTLRKMAKRKKPEDIDDDSDFSHDDDPPPRQLLLYRNETSSKGRQCRPSDFR